MIFNNLYAKHALERRNNITTWNAHKSKTFNLQENIVPRCVYVYLYVYIFELSLVNMPCCLTCNTYVVHAWLYAFVYMHVYAPCNHPNMLHLIVIMTAIQNLPNYRFKSVSTSYFLGKLVYKLAGVFVPSNHAKWITSFFGAYILEPMREFDIPISLLRCWIWRKIHRTNKQQIFNFQS